MIFAFKTNCLECLLRSVATQFKHLQWLGVDFVVGFAVVDY